MKILKTIITLYKFPVKYRNSKINSFVFCQNVCYHIYIIYDKMGGIGDGGKQEKGF